MQFNNNLLYKWLIWLYNVVILYILNTSIDKNNAQKYLLIITVLKFS